MPTFTFTPDFGMSKLERPSVIQVKFGDGYESRIAEGINSSRQSWSLSFNNRSVLEATQIDDFFRSCGAFTSFLWTPPGEPTALNFVCREWTKTFGTGQYFSISCVFEQVYV